MFTSRPARDPPDRDVRQEVENPGGKDEHTRRGGSQLRMRGRGKISPAQGASIMCAGGSNAAPCNPRSGRVRAGEGAGIGAARGSVPGHPRGNGRRAGEQSRDRKIADTRGRSELSAAERLRGVGWGDGGGGGEAEEEETARGVGNGADPRKRSGRGACAGTMKSELCSVNAGWPVS